MLVVPAGRWLTGPFNLTNHFTLFLDHDAVILATQDISDWPIIDPLPSYGRGRDATGGRYSNLIMGYNLTDVVITGNNGTIDGQVYSSQVIVSGITILAPVNSPNTDGINPDSSSNYTDE
ncbi:hypothetical protein OPV22_002267 [Ensete ventricosum]|uniref:Pectate lyase superfamily protein domain-containing protein n=1 Tax=Ensete ventricosum TaxID=4639 RepID=A0AAV8RXD3_ENSVE|nr:hypothetical protein OPV22_002267 [Ensete ventricosum]